MKKRLLSILLALMMIIGMIPATTLTAFAAAGGEVYVGGVSMHDGDYLAVGATKTQTTKPSGGYAYYNDGKLTLNNYSYEGKGYEYESSLGYYAVIYSKNDLTLELIGNNTLTQTDDDSDIIYVYGANLTVGGEGKLTGTSGGYALYADKDITINGGTVEVSTYFTCIYSYGDVIINDGDITAESKNRIAINSRYDVTVNGGNVTATGARAIVCSGFTVAEGLIQASTTVDGTLGEYVAANHDSYKKIVVKTPDVYVGGVGMYDGDYLAVGATKTQTTKPSGGYAYYKNGKLTLNNYSYEGKGYLNGGYYAVIYSKNDLTLELIGNNTLTLTDSNSNMIHVDGANLTVGGDGKFTGTSRDSALYADKDITINGGTVEVSTYFNSILSYGDVIINDGDITAESKRAAIYSEYDVTVNGGNVTAIGARAIVGSGFTVAEGLKIQASTTVDGALGEYVAANLGSYKKIVIKSAKDGWVEENGKWYFYENGVKVTGWLKDGTKWYYMDANGAMTTGWQKVDGKWYYLNNNMKTGWVSVSGKWYYLGTNGAMTTGWQKVSGKWYYMNANGVMQTGWQKISGKWYYLKNEMKTGWQRISGKWYYLNNEMKTGWQQIGGKWYYLGTDGAMKTGWVQLSGKWYYLGTDGAMRTGWVQLSGKWYYLNSSGVMVTGTQTIDGKTYKFNSSGVWIG